MTDQNAARALADAPDSSGGQPASVSVPAPASRGTPSAQLQQSGLIPGEEASGGDYEGITDAAPEQGVFQIVGGYLDDQGVVHTEVHLRSMNGEDEDLLGNRAIPILDRISTIVKQCVVRIGSITEKGQIGQAVDRLPIGSRTHLLICLRRTTHWKQTKDQFDMNVRCPNDDCQQEDSYAIDLSSIETFDMPTPTAREHSIDLTDSKSHVVWRVAASAQEKVLDLVTDKDDKATLTYAIIVRIVSINDQDMRLSATDMLTTDHKKLRFSPRAQKLYEWARKLTVNDREELRKAFLEQEPGVNTEVEFTCRHCHNDFRGNLGIAQESFWFPSATSRRSRMRSST